MTVLPTKIESKFEDLPYRIFLDTNIINLLVKYSEPVFEMAPPPDNCSEEIRESIRALGMLFFCMRRAPWDIRVSRETIIELENTPDRYLRDELTSYGSEFLHFSAADDLNWASDFARRMRSTKYLSALPHDADRDLIVNAVALGCDTFCTLDLKSIHKKRHRLNHLPINILTPKEWWELVHPWAGLYI